MTNIDLVTDPDWIKDVASNSGTTEAFHLRGQHDFAAEMAFDPNQPRDEIGRWTDSGRAAVLTLDHTDQIIDGMLESMRAWQQVQIDNEVGSAYQAAWKAERGMKMSDHERYAYGIYTGDPDATAEWRSAMENTLAENTPASDDTVAGVEAAVAYEADNPRFTAMLDRYGEVPVVPVERLSGMASARYGPNMIRISEVASTTTSGPAQTDTTFTVDPSMSGTLRHEYGHHVESRLTNEQVEAFSAARRAWGAGLDQRSMERVYMDEGPGAGEGLSLYARMNHQEAFAEAFGLVTHRDFDPDADYGRAQPVIDFMKELVGS
jgi:hypothetical protein